MIVRYSKSTHSDEMEETIFEKMVSYDRVYGSNSDKEFIFEKSFYKQKRWI
jgi:hypothetical protein